MVFSNGTDADKAQNFIDSRVEKRRRGVYGPPLSSRYVFFIDDLMMPFKDRFGTQSANELIRQWFDFNGWYDTKNLEFKRIDDIQFISCITTYDSGKSAISTRNEWHWSYLGAISMDEKHYVSMFTQILDNYAISWPPMVQGETLKNCVKATLSLYDFFEKTIKPTPSKFLYYFNIRHMFKIMYGIAEVDPSYLSSEFNFGKLWLHESWRTLCDRICDDKDAKQIHKKMREIAKTYFNPGKDRMYSKDRGRPFFTYFNKGSEGLYLEALNWGETVGYLKRFLFDYNELHKKQKINVVLFDSMIEFIIKMLRIIKQPFSHGIMIGIEGSGKEALCRLATALASYQYHSIKFDANYNNDDWQNDLKKLLLTAGIEMREIVFHLKHN
jgi:dynein heavy chain